MKPTYDTAGIDTAEGFIPHLRVTTQYGKMRLPIRVDVRKKNPSRNAGYELVPARTKEGLLIYALPNDGRFIAVG